MSERGAASMVAAGILISRITGLLRDSVFAHYFGNTDVADAFRAAFRIPNFLQNMFGEGVLSASLIPVYARLRAEGKHDEATRVAEAVGAILAIATSVMVLVGILAAPWLIAVIAPGFQGDKRELTIRLVRIFFPGVGLLVFSAWCLGILNSHRKFFLSYVAPVVSNATIIATFLIFGSRAWNLVIVVAWGTVVGSALQFLVQLPVVLGLLRPFPGTFHLRTESVSTVLRNFFPVFVSRGVVQISAYVDSLLASFLPTGAVAALAYAQTLNLLPVSLFGMSVSAAELPAMSSALGSDAEIAVALRQRISRGLTQISFFVIPSAVAFILLGDVVVSTIYQSGSFTAADVRYVWAVLAGYAIGLLASTSGRLYSSGFYALRNTRTPLNFAAIRVLVSVASGAFAALVLPGMLGFDRRWGVAGLALASGLSGWLEFLLLRHSLQARIGRVEYPAVDVAKLWLAALLAGGVGFGIHYFISLRSPRLEGLIVLVPYGLVYFGLAAALGVAEPLRRFIQPRKTT